MKSQIKRFSKSTLAVVLSLCMLMSCMTVGIIATDAARVTGEKVGFSGTNTVYFKNTANWSTVYVYFYSRAYDWTYDNKVHGGSKSAQGCVAGPLKMTSVGTSGGTDLYSYTYTGTWTYVAFTEASQSDYEHFHNTKVVPCNNGCTSTKMMCSPGTATRTVNSCTDYYSPTWSAVSIDETTYSVSVVSADTNKGTVAAATVNAGATTAVTLPTATAKLGYKFKNWTATSPATISSGSTSATAGKVKATGTDGKVTANWEENTSLEFFISGRFRVKASDSATTYTNTYDGTGDWADNCEKSALKLTRSGAYTYTLDTHCTMKELSAQIGGGSYQGDQVFYVHDKTNSKNYFAGSGKTFTSTSGDNVTLVTSGGSNSNLKFSSDNENGYVVLSFNPTTMKLSYTIRGAKTTLSAPSITYNSSSATTQSVTAAEGQKARISWSAVSNAGSYEVYKGSSKVATVTTTYYDIERGYSYGGNYTVKAVPSDSSSYLTSAASNGINFTFSKVTLAAPTVGQSATEVVKGGTATFTITNTNSSYALGTDFKYQHTGRNNTTYADMSTGGLTWTTGQLNTVGTDTFKFKAVALKTDYFASSGETTKTVNVVAPTTTLYVSKDIAFTHAYIYQDGSHIHVAWPGQATNASPWVDAAPLNYYKLEFQEDWTSFRVIMNDGRNDNPDKTADMTTGVDIGGTYYIDTAVSNKVPTLNEGAPLPSLSAPTNVQLGGSSSNQTVNAVKNGKINLTWSAVSGAGSYDVYKDGTKVTATPITTTTYAIEKGNSYSGTYTVVANPADSTTHTASKPSTGIKLTVNKVALAQPTIELNKNAVNNTDTGVTVTVTNYNALKDACTFTLSGATVGGSQSSISNTGVFSITGYNSSAYNGANNNITVTAAITSGNSDYYSIANGTSATATLKVYKPDFALCGDVNKVTSTGITTPSNDDWNAKSVFVIESTTQTPGVYSLVFTTTAEAYLGLRNTSNRYSVKVDGVSYNTYDNSYTIPNEGKSGMELINVSNGSMKFAANKTYTITVNQTDNTVSVSTDSWNVKTTARYKDYNLATGSYKAVATGTTGGTVSPATVSVKKGQSTTLTATAASGYTFTGWFTAEACTGTAVSTAASYSVTPAADTTYYALFTKNEPAKVNISVANVSGATISATWNGTTKTNGQTLSNVPVGAQVSVTVTPADNKYLISTTPTLTSGKFTVTDSTTSITATLGDKLKVNVSTNNASWGTVTVDKAYAKPGDTVKITLAPAGGTPKKITVTRNDTSAKVAEWTYSNGSFSSVGAAPGKAGASVGANADPLTFTMPDSAVSVAAEYEEYVGTSEYIYHGVNTSGQAVSGYESKAMSEGVIGGQKYAYYNVTGRESVNNDQLFYISKGGSTDGRYVYFTSKGTSYDDWKIGSGSNDHVTAYFYNSSGAVGDAWPGKAMTWVSGTDNNGDKNWKLEIPAGATGVIFSNGKSSGDFKQTHDINLTNTNGSYYPSGYSSNKYEVTQWTTPGENSGIIAGTDYYWDTDVYTDQWWTGGFSNHNVNNDHNYAKPKDGNSQSFADCKDDYYIVVLYPNTSYTFSLPGHDNETKTVGSKPMVLWMAQLPGQTAEVASYVKVYAKDGAIRRDGDQPERNNRTYSTFEHHANTFVYSDSGYANHIGTRSSHDNQNSEGTGYDGYTYDYIQKFEKGKTLYIKTNLKDDTYMNRYYLYAYSINGKCYQLHTVAESETGSVTEAFTVPKDWEYDYVEITPIYFLRDSKNAITFYVEGYDEEVMHAGWGNTPFVYPFYQDKDFNYVTNVNNPFGGYPGQPMVFYKGNYYTQLPRTFDAIPETGGTAVNCTIKGVTLGNGYWDDIHVFTKEVKSHFQTYDYDDLYKIYKEYPKQADHIICSFKYRTKKNNDEPGNNPTYSNYNSTNGNGWEVLTDYYGRPVDIFGNQLTDAALTAAQDMITNKTADSATTGVVHAISQDYKSNSAGEYGTEWAIYDTTGTKVTGGNKTTIVPSALAITKTDNFQNYDTATRAFQGIYDALKAKTTTVVGQPVVVTYEKSIYGGGDKADRCDARWYYSKSGQTINATTRIEYTDDGKTWQTDTYNTGTGTGSHTGTQAYFTGKASTAKDEPDSGTAISGKNTTTISGTTGGGYYTFNAENAGQYQFVGWYLLRDNYQNISVRSSYAEDATTFASHAEQSKNGDIYVARFKKTATGTLDIFHEVHPQTSGYGHVYVEAVVKDSGGTQQGSKIGSVSGGTLTDHIQIPSTYIRSGEGYTVEATFKAVAYPTSHFDDFYATIGELLETYDGYAFIKSKNIDKANGTATITYDVDKLFSVQSGSPVQTVTSITHYSKFSLRTDLTYNLEYRFTTRYYGDKLYKYTNKAFTAEELRSYFRSQIENDQTTSIEIDKQFVQRKAPFESNYREDLTWVIDNVKIENNVGKLTATQVPIEWAKATVYDFTDAGVMSTTTMEAPLEKLFNKNVESKPADATEAATAITNWSVDDSQLYAPIRTSYDNNGTAVPLYLDHWEVYQLDSFTYKTDSNGAAQMATDGYNLDIDTGKSKLVAKTYGAHFNYIGYEDYAIVPVYNTVRVNGQQASDSRTDSSATLLTITRNHWNTTVAGNTQGGKYVDAGDRLYVDMMLNYNYQVNSQNTLLRSTGDNIKVGFIVKSYTIDYSSGHGVKVYSGNSKTYVFTNEEKATIDNKNRIEYCYGFANTQNNSQYGLNFEFTPFIVDTANQATSEGDTINISGQEYKTLYGSETVTVLDGVNFYMIGKSDTTWDN